MLIDTQHTIFKNSTRQKKKQESNYSPIFERILRKLTKSITRGSIIFEFGSNKMVKCDSGFKGPEAVIKIHSRRMLQRIISGGYLGLAEGYINEEWSSPSLAKLFDFGIANLDVFDKNLTTNVLSRCFYLLIKRLSRNSKRKSRKNIANHYDLGNNFFAEWLDPTFTYSSAIFDNKTHDLLLAQQNKYQRIINELRITKDHNVLEIGCGWGGFAEFTAYKTGAKIEGITISGEQHEYALNRIIKAGLEDQVKIKFKDYRESIGQFDRIVSIEMLEAVGEEYWPLYFKTISNRLKKNGRAIIQVITVPDDYFDFYRKDMDFIQRYIFPGGMLLCRKKIKEQSFSAGMQLVDTFMFGPSYAQTLDIWHSSFQKNWANIQRLGFDRKFKRIWEYYLNYTSAGFRSGAIDVGQFHLCKF